MKNTFDDMNLFCTDNFVLSLLIKQFMNNVINGVISFFSLDLDPA